MSRMIMCDGCEKTMFEDSRSEKGDYHEIWIDRSDSYHVCRECYEKFMTDVLRQKWSEDNCQWEPRSWTE